MKAVLKETQTERSQAITLSGPHGLLQSAPGYGSQGFLGCWVPEGSGESLHLGRKALMCQRLGETCGKGICVKGQFPRNGENYQECLLVEGCLTGGHKRVDMHGKNKKRGRTDLKEPYAPGLSGRSWRVLQSPGKGLGFAMSMLTSLALCCPAKGATWPMQPFVAGFILDMLVVRASALSDFSTEHKLAVSPPTAWPCL